MEERTATQAVQYEFAAHIRHPERNPRPSDVPDRRMAIYRDLFYKNIESFISSGFPVLREIISGDHWHEMARDFIDRHQSKTPYFPEISEEFLEYLQLERGEVEGDPPFMIELAHYEWVELALDISTEEIPQSVEEEKREESADDKTEKVASDAAESDMLQSRVVLSPLAWNLTYQWPVHRISPEFQPEEPPEAPTYLLVYRNREDRVRFMEMNPVTARLVSLIKERANSDSGGEEREAVGVRVEALLNQIAEDLQGAVSRDAVHKGGIETLEHLLEIDAVLIAE